jgi:4-amino-4-deoxy-L-arabinose transferase-like glycosyltransferase
MTRGLLFILLSSTIVKLFLLIPAHSTYPTRDSGDYYATARHLFKTGDYVGGRTPLYPAFLWGSVEVMALGGREYIAPMPKRAAKLHPGAAFTDLDFSRLLQVLASTFTAWLMYLIGRELFDHRTGLLAGGIFAFNPEFIAFSHLLWAETLFMMLNAGWFLLLLRGLRDERVQTFAMAGVIFALATLTRHVIYTGILLIVPWLYLMRPAKHRSTARFAAAFVLAWVVVIAPWSIRNYLVYDEFVLLVPNSGIALLFGVSENVNREFSETGIAKIMDPVERDRRAMERSLEIIERDPFGYLRRMVEVNLVGLWSPGSQIIDHLQRAPGVNELTSYPMAPGWLGRLLIAASLAAYVFLIVAGIIGASLAPKWNATLLPIALVVHASVLHAIVGGFSRHRLYVMPFFLLYAAYLLSLKSDQISSLVTDRRKALAIAALGLFGVFCLAGNYDMAVAKWNAFGP